MIINEIAKQAKTASKSATKIRTDQKNKVLQLLADKILLYKEVIFSENKKDINYAISANISDAMIERLTISEKTISSIVSGLINMTTLEDPINNITERIIRPNGLMIHKKTVPMGVIAIIYESRPNVTMEAFSLTWKTGNAVILKGGKEAIHSNKIFVKIIREVLEYESINPDFVQLFTPINREETKELMKCDKYIDLLIPRGSARLIQTVINESTIPVIETGAGNCHVYVDWFADVEMAVRIAYNAKVQRPSVCNSCETILVHKNIAKEFLRRLDKVFNGRVQIFGDEITMKYMKDVKAVSSLEFATEFNDYIIAIKVVDSIDEAINHIEEYSTSHSETIITDDIEQANYFLQEVDSSTVYHNASTRFTDGFEFGFGAEIGISTQKLHVRGPMGLDSLTSYKYIVYGTGQIR